MWAAACRWEGNNGPRPTDLVGTTNLIKAAPSSLKRFVLVTSAGVERPKEFPWAILNTFGAPAPPAHSVQAHTPPAHSLQAHTTPVHSVQAHTPPVHSMQAHTPPVHSVQAHTSRSPDMASFGCSGGVLVQDCAARPAHAVGLSTMLLLRWYFAPSMLPGGGLGCGCMLHVGTCVVPWPYSPVVPC
jgi:hypothetical protein